MNGDPLEAEVGKRILYLYGVVPGDQPLPIRSSTPLEVVSFASLVAVVESVPASDFSSETLEQKLQCVDWVAPLARKHTAVLEDAMQHGPVVPARLCTLFSDAAALVNSLVQNEQRLRDTLQRLRGRHEWGFKIFCDEEELRATTASSDPTTKALEAAAAIASPGQAFVLRKQCDGQLAAIAFNRIDEVVDEAFEPLSSLATDIRFRSPLSRAATGRSDTMVLNAALFVDITARPAFLAAKEELASRFGTEGFSFELTGPWPPYSFCDDDGVARDPGEDESAFAGARLPCRP